MGFRSTLILGITIGLLAGSVGGVTAQEEEAPPLEPVVVTMVIRPGDDIGQPTYTEVDGRVERRGTVWAPTIVTASDPRLEGRITLSNDQDAYPGPDGPESFVLGMGTMRIETVDGAWQGSTPYFGVAADDRSVGSTVVLVGKGAYEGLYAVLDQTDWADIHGVIFPAPPPPVPAAP